MTSGGAKQSYARALSYLTELACAMSTDGQPDPATAVAMGEDVLAVAQVLVDEPQLRRALADSDRPSDGRKALLRSLLATRVRDDSLQVLSNLVGGNWARPSELLNATEILGVEAFLLASEHLGELGTVEDELFRFGQIVAGDSRLAAVLGDTSTGDRRERLVRDLLEGKALPMTVRLAVIALAGIRGRNFAGSMIWLVESAAKRRERMIAYVTAAVPLTADEERRLRTLLSARYGSKLSIKMTVDPGVLGGMRVQVGSDLFDGTVARMLLRARHALMT